MKPVLAILLLACLPAWGDATTNRFSFATGILPILTKAGCNTGECHGAAVGAGGFRLSLLGYDPHGDYLNITRERDARRIELDDPGRSLFLRKPARLVRHKGGRVIKDSSDEFRRLREWIAAGVPEGDRTLTVAAITVYPQKLQLSRPGETGRIRVLATLSDGTRQDVTASALYDPADEGVATVDEAGAISMHRRGVTVIMIRYGGQVAAITAGVPFQDAPVEVGLPVYNFIDRHVSRQLGSWRLTAAPLSEAAVFFRRVHLDLIGRLPESGAVEAFLSEPDSPKRRRDVIRTLLQEEAFTDLWTLKLADLLLIHPKKQGPEGSRVYHDWLRRQIATRTPVDQVVSKLLTAGGDTGTHGPANFHKLASDPRDMGEYVSRTFLGVRLACARCHNHPFDRWTRRDYHEFAAFFADTVVENNRVVTRNRGEVLHPDDQSVARPRPLGGPHLPEGQKVARRERLANWLVSAENRGFSRAWVNRIWKELMGRGIVEPVDDIRVSNPPSHPELLEALELEFLTHGFDLRHLIGTIANSATYQLSSLPRADSPADERFFFASRLRPLSGQILADAITSVVGVPESIPGFPDVHWTTRIADVTAASRSLDVFGRCPRTDGCDSEDAWGGGLPQALLLINGDSINSRLRSGDIARIAEGRPDDETIRQLYLRALSRPPTPKEASHWQARAAGAADRKVFFQDLAWALLNSREFTFNH